MTRWGLFFGLFLAGCSADDPGETECPVEPPLYGTHCLGAGTCNYTPCAKDGVPSVSAVCIDGTFSLSTHLCGVPIDGGTMVDAATDTMEAETAPPLSGGIGITCTVDETCDPSDLCGSLLGYPGDDPAKSCSSDSRMCAPDKDGISRCDGAKSICVGEICLASCRLESGVISGCPGATACNLVAFDTTGVGHGYCAFGCTKDADCLDPDAPYCTTEIGRCRPTKDPLAKHPGDACSGNIQCLCVSGTCQRFCKTGDPSCTCVPFGPAFPSGVAVPAGLGGTCK